MRTRLLTEAGKIEGNLYSAETHNEEIKRVLSPLTGEIVGSRLMRVLGIGAPTEIVWGLTADQAKVLGNDWIIKRLLDGRLKRGEADQGNIAIRRIPGAISIHDLSLFYGIDGPPIEIAFDGHELSAEDQRAATAFFDFLRLGSLSENVEALKEGFKGNYGKWGITAVKDSLLQETLDKIKAAIAWNSPQMLAIHAARLFLGCTTAHGGNVLVDSDAKLYSIDHEFVVQTDGSEIRALFQEVKRGGKAWESLRGIANLQPTDIICLLHDLPPDVEWPLGSHLATVSYYLARLTLWKRLFQEGEESSGRKKIVAPAAPNCDLELCCEAA